MAVAAAKVEKISVSPKGPLWYVCVGNRQQLSLVLSFDGLFAGPICALQA